MGADTARLKTAYVILRRNDAIAGAVEGITPGLGEERWEPVATLDASSSEAAIRAYAETQAADPNAWDSAWLVAVPARSWRPTAVTLKTTRVVSIGNG